MFSPSFQFHFASKSRSQSPTWQHCTMSAGAPGSRSKTIIVGRATSFFARERSVQLDVGEVRGPDQRRKILREAIMHVAIVAFAPDLRGLHPFRSMGRAVFFVEEFAFHAIRITLHRQRAIFQMRQKDRRDLDVVVDQCALGEAVFRIKDLVEIRDREGSAFDDQFALSCSLLTTITRISRMKDVDVHIRVIRVNPRVPWLTQKNRSGESIGCGWQMRATQCSQVSCPLRIWISTRRK